MVVKTVFEQTELGLFPSDWEVVLLTDAVDFIHGKAHEKHISLSGKYIVVNSKYISTEGKIAKYSNISFQTAKKEDVLTVLSDLPNGKALAKTYYVESNNKYAVNQRVCIWRPKNISFGRFLYHSLNRHSYFIALDNGVSQTHILNHHIKACKIILPPLPEQTAIATALSDMDALIAQTEKLIEKKKAIKQGVMQELLRPKEGWVTKKLGEVFEIEKGAQINRSTLDISGEFPVYNGGIAPSGYTSSFNTLENTIIISEGGNSCGYVNYIKSKFWRGGHCYEIRPNNYLNKHFAYFLLKHNEAEIMALRVGSGLPNIQRSSLAKFEIKFPDSNEQALISNILIDLQDSFDLLIAKLQKLKLQKQGMMQALLTGKIRLV